ncbi:MAG: hypothetical protein JWR01_2738 [Subtercola sp.]|nr:hypothetical protein [Subtercola sp.]
MSAADPTAFLVVTVVVDPEYEAEFNRWYDEEHFPDRMALPGFLRGFRSVSRDHGETRYLAYYELVDKAVLESAEYLAIGGPGATTEWTERLRPHLLSIDRRVYENVAPATAGAK